MNPETTTIVINLAPGHTDFQAVALREAVSRFMKQVQIQGTIGTTTNTPVEYE